MTLNTWSKCSSVMEPRNQRPSARVGEDDVYASFFFTDLSVDPVKVRQVGNVSLNCGDIRTNGSHGSFKFGLTTTDDVDVGALLDELLGRGEANTRTPASDECNLPFKLFDMCFLLGFRRVFSSLGVLNQSGLGIAGFISSPTLPVQCGMPNGSYA